MPASCMHRKDINILTFFDWYLNGVVLFHVNVLRSGIFIIVIPDFIDGRNPFNFNRHCCAIGSGTQQFYLLNKIIMWYRIWKILIVFF